MHEYEVKHGHETSILDDGLRRIVAEVFGSSSDEGSKIAGSFGALRKIAAWTDGKRLFVETQTDPSVDAATAAETIRRFNAFLQRATGYTSKERAKRAQSRAKAGR